MHKTIELIQEKGNFAFTLDAKDSFDVGELEPDGKARNVWNKRALKIYEIQNNAIKSEIDRCIEKVKEQNTALVFVTNSKKTKEEIERLTENKYKCLKLPAFETEKYGDYLQSNKNIKGDKV